MQFLLAKFSINDNNDFYIKIVFHEKVRGDFGLNNDMSLPGDRFMENKTVDCFSDQFRNEFEKFLL